LRSDEADTKPAARDTPNVNHPATPKIRPPLQIEPTPNVLMSPLTDQESSGSPTSMVGGSNSPSFSMDGKTDADGKTAMDAITLSSSSNPDSLPFRISSSSSSRASEAFEWNKVVKISRHMLDENDNDAPIIEVQLGDGAEKKWVTLESVVSSKDMKVLKLLLDFSRLNGNLQLFENEIKWKTFFPKLEKELTKLAKALLDDGGSTNLELANELLDDVGSTGTISNYSSDLS
jgi:hypothetical protein